MEPKITSHIIKAVVIAAIMITWILVAGKTGIPVNGTLQYLPYIILVAGIIISCLLFARQNAGKLKFADVFANGFKTATVVALLMALFTFIAVKFVYPPATAAEIEANTKIVQEQNNLMPNEAREMVIEGEKRQWVVFVSSAIFTSLIGGAAGALAGAALAKKNL